MKLLSYNDTEGLTVKKVFKSDLQAIVFVFDEGHRPKFRPALSGEPNLVAGLLVR